MGTYTSLYLDDYELVSSKSRVVPEVMTVFVEADRRIRWRRASDAVLVDGPGSAEDDIEREDDYVVKASHASRRLDVMGFTLARCEREFEEIRLSELKSLQEAKAEEDLGDASDPDSWLNREIAKYSALTFANYRAGFETIFKNKLHWYDRDQHFRRLSSVEEYILDDQHEDWPHFGFFCNDVRAFLRFALTFAADDSELKQSVAELVSSGWVLAADRVRDDAVRLLLERYPENAPRIVLTEGSSDALILKKALLLLYPELVEYYTFFDFQGARAAGGASQAVSVVKAFAAAGVANRIVAILDNDTAAHEARRALRDVHLPAHMVVSHYPRREWLASYPTLGPSGEINLDINGRAGNLEMYLGRDVLTINGQLERVQWAGYSSAMQSYQGELVNKGEVSSRWFVKAERAATNPANLVAEDWEDLRAIWEVIFAAFNDH